MFIICMWQYHFQFQQMSYRYNVCMLDVGEIFQIMETIIDVTLFVCIDTFE